MAKLPGLQCSSLCLPGFPFLCVEHDEFQVTTTLGKGLIGVLVCVTPKVVWLFMEVPGGPGDHEQCGRVSSILPFVSELPLVRCPTTRLHSQNALIQSSNKLVFVRKAIRFVAIEYLFKPR